MSSLAYFAESAEMLTSISFYQMLLEQKQYLAQENLAKLTCTFEILECIILLLCGKVAFCVFC